MTGNLKVQTKLTESAILIAGVLMILGPGALISLNIQITERFFGAKDMLAQSPIGEITKPRKVVRKKGEEDSAYLKAKQGDPVFEGDTVLTGKESSTKVTLSDGTVLELGPESMIRIEPVRSFSFKGIQKKFEITVETGAIKAKAKSNSAPVVLKSSEGQVLKEIAPVNAVKKKTPGFLPNLAQNLPIPKPVTKPNLTPAPEPEEFEQEEAAVSVPPVVVKAPVTAPAVPSTGASSTVNPITPPPSAMSKLPGVSEKDLIPDAEEMIDTPLEAEEKPILSKPVLAMAPKPKPVPSLILPTLPTIPPVAVSTPTPTPVPVIKATPTPIPTPTPRKRETEIVLLQATLKEQKFYLSWRDQRKNPKAQYKVSVIHGGKTSNIIASETETTWALPAKKEGVMEWFVEGLNDDGTFSKSNKRSETWKLESIVSPDLMPEGSEILGDKVRLRWKDKRKNPGGPYKVSITHLGRTDTVISSTLDATWSLPLRPTGKAEWFIEAPDAAEGLIKSKSLAIAWRFQTPTLMFPKPDAAIPEDFLKGDRHELLMTWAPLSTCKEYHLNVSISPRFESLLYTKITARNFQRFSVERTGEYFWRVGCSYGESFTVYSIPRRFKILGLNRTKKETREAKAAKKPAPAGNPANSTTPGPSPKPPGR